MRYEKRKRQPSAHRLCEKYYQRKRLSMKYVWRNTEDWNLREELGESSGTKLERSEAGIVRQDVPIICWVQTICIPWNRFRKFSGQRADIITSYSINEKDFKEFFIKTYTCYAAHSWMALVNPFSNSHHGKTSTKQRHLLTPSFLTKSTMNIYLHFCSEDFMK